LSFAFATCRLCGKEFYKEKGKPRVCGKCLQGMCKHKYRIISASANANILQCDKCHHVKIVKKVGMRRIFEKSSGQV